MNPSRFGPFPTPLVISGDKIQYKYYTYHKYVLLDRLPKKTSNQLAGEIRSPEDCFQALPLLITQLSQTSTFHEGATHGSSLCCSDPSQRDDVRSMVFFASHAVGFPWISWFCSGKPSIFPMGGMCFYLFPVPKGLAKKGASGRRCVSCAEARHVATGTHHEVDQRHGQLVSPAPLLRPPNVTWHMTCFAAVRTTCVC